MSDDEFTCMKRQGRAGEGKVRCGRAVYHKTGQGMVKKRVVDFRWECNNYQIHASEN